MLLFILYNRTSHPCIALTKMVTFGTQVYTVMWFKIKQHWMFTGMIELINKTPEDVRRTKWSKHFPLCKHRKILAYMLKDSDEATRNAAVQKILCPRFKYARGIWFYNLPYPEFSALQYTSGRRNPSQNLQ